MSITISKRKDTVRVTQMLSQIGCADCFLIGLHFALRVAEVATDLITVYSLARFVH